MNTHQKNSLILYSVIILMTLLCIIACYFNLIVLKNFKQFDATEEEPDPFDFYVHQQIDT